MTIKKVAQSIVDFTVKYSNYWSTNTVSSIDDIDYDDIIKLQEAVGNALFNNKEGLSTVLALDELTKSILNHVRSYDDISEWEENLHYNANPVNDFDFKVSIKIHGLLGRNADVTIRCLPFTFRYNLTRNYVVCTGYK